MARGDRLVALCFVQEHAQGDRTMSAYYTKRHRKACADAIAYLRSHGFRHAEHRSREGEDDDRGDIAGIPGVVIEVKTGQTPRWAEWLEQLDAEIAREHKRTGFAPDGLVLWRRPGVTSPAGWLSVRSFGAEVARRLDEERAA